MPLGISDRNNGKPTARANIYYDPHQNIGYQSYNTTSRQSKTLWQADMQTISQEKPL